jgi:hypothetical protein
MASSPWSVLLLGMGPAADGTLVTLGFESGAMPIIVPALEGVDWSLMYRPALALAPTLGNPPGVFDWTRRGGESD